jgi:nicotinamide-nucleotide amidase
MTEALAPAVSDRVDSLVEHVLKRACQQRLKLATAESCTGGLLASLLTDVPGRSHVFERGYVTYTDAAKHELLGVPWDILKAFGAVSEAAARSMADGALAKSQADLTLAITGWAERGPRLGDQAGKVWFACARRGEPTWTRLAMLGDIGRARVRLRCLEIALEMALDAMHVR